MREKGEEELNEIQSNPNRMARLVKGLNLIVRKLKEKDV